MKKIISLVLALFMCLLVFTACKADEKKTLIVGYTIYEPMNYLDGTELVGFDTELAEAVAAKLDMDIKFVEIKWDNKYIELNGGTINCIWNGFTANCADDDGVQRTDKVDISHYYMNNEQCVVIRSEDDKTYTTSASLAGKKGAAEEGSAGASVAVGFIGDNAEESNLFIGKDAQTGALTELLGDTADFAVIDLTMAKSKVGKGDYANLAIVDEIEIPAEKYAIGFKKGSDLKDKVNGALEELAADGTMTTLAEKYGLSNYVITNFN